MRFLKVVRLSIRKSLITLFGFCLLVPCFGQYDLDLAGKSTKYLGEVKLVTRELHEPVFKDEKLVSFRLKPVNIYPNVYRDHFNKDGQIILREGIDPKCGEQKICVLDKVSFTYENTQLIKKENRKANGKLVSRHVYEGGSIMATKSGLTKKTNVYRNGNQEIKETEGFNGITLKTVTILNSRKLPTRYERYWTGELTDIEEYTYKDSLSSLVVGIEKLIQKTQNRIEKKLTYDKSNNLLRLDSYFNDDYSYGYAFEYKYDEEGNWIERIQKNSNDKIINKVVKIIEYW